MTAVSGLAKLNATINKFLGLGMSLPDTVVQGEAIESDNESDLGFRLHSQNQKVKLIEIKLKNTNSF